MKFEDYRKEIQATENISYFQTGTYGPTPTSVIQEVNKYMLLENSLGPASKDAKEIIQNKDNNSRSVLSKFLNTDTNNLSITQNTSQSIAKIFKNIEWKSGDEIIISSSEHVSTLGFIQTINKKYSINVKIVNAFLSENELLNKIDTYLNKKVKLVCMSHVTSPDGIILPIKKIIDLCKSHNVLIMIDGAQSVGIMPVDLQEYDPDFYVGSGHKWMLGPLGTGFLYISNRILKDFNPDNIALRHPWTFTNLPDPKNNARGQTEIGTYNHPIVIGLGKAVGNIIELGIQNIQNDLYQKMEFIRNELNKVNKINIITPINDMESGGIVTIMINGYNENSLKSLVNKLYDDYKILVKFQWMTAPPDIEKVGIRISIAFFNTQEEILFLTDSLKKEIGL